MATSEVIAYHVLLSRRQAQQAGGEGSQGATYGPWRDQALLVPLEVRDPIAPGHPTAKMEFNFPNTIRRDHAWKWGLYFAADDRVAVVSDHGAESTPDRPAVSELLFTGHIADVEFSFDAKGNESCIVTANGYPHRLAYGRDYLAYGRHMQSKGGDLTLYSGLPCIFNAAGKPNCIAGAYDGQGAPTTVPRFTYESDPAATWWTAIEAIEYLLWNYNADETWLINPEFSNEQRTDSPVILIDVDGLGLWAALAKVADHGGYDVYESLGINADDGGFENYIQMTKRGSGAELILDHQPPNADGSLPILNPAKTNLFAAKIAEATASCVTCPVVAGGRDLSEITIELGQAWDPSDLASIAIIEPGQEKADATNTYCKRYWTGGSQFPSYANVGRLWDANTDGYFSGSPYNLSVPDVGQYVEEQTGVWPAMPYQPIRMLSRLAATPAHSGVQYFVEFTVDNGTSWYRLKGTHVFPDRLAVYLTVDNLAAIYPDGGAVGTDDLYTKLKEGASNVKVRLTCCITSPHRRIAAPARRATAGTAFATAYWFDKGKTGQVRQRLSGTRFASAGIPANTAAETTRLDDIAVKLQDLNEDKLLEASLTIEWIEADDAQLCMVVKKIGGIGVDLSTNAGAARRYPRIVRRQFNLDPERIQTILTVDTHRQSPVV